MTGVAVLPALASASAAELCAGRAAVSIAPGAYEVVSSRVAAGGGEKLVEEAVKKLIEHRQQFLPELGRAPR